MKSSTIQTRHWIIKRAAQDCRANAILMRRKRRDNDKCPLCGQSETVLHVYKCQDKRVKNVWEQCIYELEQVMIENNTDPEIRTQLCQGLVSWQSDSLKETHDLITTQSLIGWDGIMEGCIGTHWIAQQQMFYSREANKKVVRNGLLWSLGNYGKLPGKFGSTETLLNMKTIQIMRKRS
jgi:hypothetical protein